ncbi:MAG: NOL1/NOP2/sun family putative RNA methylase [Candidatus Methanodesulfokora sp.]
MLPSNEIPDGLLKPSFEEKYRKMLGSEYKEFLSFLAKRTRKSIRINRMKGRKEDIIALLKEDGWVLKEIPWYSYGFWIEPQTEGIGNTIAHKLGLIYVQEAASMAPPVVLNPRPGELILDLAAAPGSKTTQMSEMMEWRGTIVANDVSPSRINALSSNIQRMGCMNVVINRADGRRIHRIYGEIFDRVLLDAPCSSIGQVRRSWEALKRWNQNLVERISVLQRDLAIAAYKALKPGGLMVYSTCTFDPEENELVVQSLVNRGAEVVKFDIPGLKTREGLVEWEGVKLDDSLAYTRRIYPHLNDTEGFYIALLRKVPI